MDFEMSRADCILKHVSFKDFSHTALMLSFKCSFYCGLLRTFVFRIGMYMAR